ncbi:type II secretion system protein N [Limnohabitans radicicola]|uniref:Type II secretion system protein N n=1 Tax=Limnohabitans radicicola TaxID=2771427 RepID=A0A927FF50_9BURK|nr:type II secretion system protein N [Limnohabitans radicicola]MBD8049518.1 type II secretion system protein N [Limnohabitans radicicola]
MTTHLPRRTAVAPQGVWRWAVGGVLLGALAATGCWAPARWLTWGLSEASQGRVLLQAPRGTVWQGSAQLGLSGGAGSRDLQALPGRLSWTLGPSTQGLGLAFTLHADCCMHEPLQLQLTTRLGQWVLRLGQHQSMWPAGLLSGLGAPWNTLQPEGQLQLRTDALQLQWSAGRLQWQGLAELTARDMSSRLSTLRPMGSYQIQVTGAADGAFTATPQVQLSTLSGALHLKGQGQWLGERLRFTGEASAAEGQEDNLSNLLNIIGRRDGTRSLLSLG